MTSEINLNADAIANAMLTAGKNDGLRNKMMAALRIAQNDSEDPSEFQAAVRWPIILGLLGDGGIHRLTLANGLVFELGADSRIEQAALLSAVEHPDHVWEPQTTRLLVELARDAANVIVGGAYIGDHVLPMSRVIKKGGRVHAFEPMAATFARLRRNIVLNDIQNVVTNQLGLWDVSDAALVIEGDLALGSAVVADTHTTGDEVIRSMAIDDYVKKQGLAGIELIMLDTEGGEEKALMGAKALLSLPVGSAPNIVFEIHRHYVDWSEGLDNASVVRLLTDRGYTVYAIRDLHDNYAMAGKAIEIIPAKEVYLDGPPHGFNALATKDASLVTRLGLRVVYNVSPKLFPHKDSALHHPTEGF
ncbi:MAG: FkbM family methyltransferase [Pseudomonadota bacterium]